MVAREKSSGCFKPRFLIAKVAATADNRAKQRFEQIHLDKLGTTRMSSLCNPSSLSYCVAG